MNKNNKKQITLKFIECDWKVPYVNDEIIVLERTLIQRKKDGISNEIDDKKGGSAGVKGHPRANSSTDH